MGSGQIIDPGFDALVADLKTLRREGVTRLRRLDLPALAQAVRSVGQIEIDEAVTPAAVEHLLRQAIRGLGSERYETVADLLYGLEPGTRDLEPPQLRLDAAERWGVSLSRFRTRWEPHLIDQTAESILRLVHEHQMRLSYLELERRSPAATRLAVEWVKRFEAYYKIWTPIYALAADITAYRSTLLEEDRPYDREPDPEVEGDEGYSQEIQAAGYGTDALFHFAMHLLLVEDFKRDYGGLWLLSDGAAEQQLAEALYRISWHSPFNEEDDSFLRVTLGQTCGRELHPFRNEIRNVRIMKITHEEWQEWLGTCRCQWDAASAAENEIFPDARNQPGIEAGCQPHQTAAAAADFVNIIDEEWQRVGDWYRLRTEHGPRNVRDLTLYRVHASRGSLSVRKP